MFVYWSKRAYSAITVELRPGSIYFIAPQYPVLPASLDCGLGYRTAARRTVQPVQMWTDRERQGTTGNNGRESIRGILSGEEVSIRGPILEEAEITVMWCG